MNERIRELAKQSGLWFVSPREDLMNDFAELIVRECVKICSDVEADTEMDLSDGALVCMAEIKEHFGVEEWAKSLYVAKLNTTNEI